MNMKKKYVIVVYDVFELRTDGTVEKQVKWEGVPFCKENLEYDEDSTYEENVRDFVEECVDNKCVCIGESYIPLHNIHGWYYDRDSVKNPVLVVKDTKVGDVPKDKPQNQNRKRGNHKKIKHRRGKPRTPAATALPFQVDKEQVKTVSMPEHEDFMTQKLPDEP